MLSFISGKMRITQETAFQVALKNCSKELGWKVSIFLILLKWGVHGNQALILQKAAASLGKIQHKTIMYWELKF